MTSIYIGLDSVSILSRQSDLVGWRSMHLKFISVWEILKRKATFKKSLIVQIEETIVKSNNKINIQSAHEMSEKDQVKRSERNQAVIKLGIVRTMTMNK